MVARPIADKLGPMLIATAALSCADREGAPTAGPEPTAVSASPTSSARPSPPAPERAFDLEAAAKKYVTDATVAWKTRDVMKQSLLYTEDAVLALPSTHGWSEASPARFQISQEQYFAGFPDLEMIYTRVVGKGNVAVAEWVLTGTNTAPLMGRPPTGREIGIRGASALTFASNGDVERENLYFDLGTMFAQLDPESEGSRFRGAVTAPTVPTEYTFFKDADVSVSAFSEQWTRAETSNDQAAKHALLDEGITVSQQSSPDDLRGRAKYIASQAEWNASFSDSKDVTRCVPAGDYVACENSWTAKWTGPVAGLKPNGTTGTIHSLYVLRVQSGAVTHATSYSNSLEYVGAFRMKTASPSAPIPSSNPSSGRSSSSNPSSGKPFSGKSPP